MSAEYMYMLKDLSSVCLWKELAIPTLPQLFSMNVKQEINLKAFIFTLPHSFFIAALFEVS